MQDYTNQLLTAINQYDPDDSQTRDHLRDLVCWVSDNAELKNDPIIADLLYIASQKMRVFGYNKLNGYAENPNASVGMMGDVGDRAIKELYRSDTDRGITLDQSQKEVIDLFQNIFPHRLLVSAPTSYGKTFLMREIVFRNKERYKNILLVFPTVALLLENAGVMSWFVKKHYLNYRIIKTVDSVCTDDENNIFVFTPERALQLLATYPDIKIDFFFFDEIYKIDEDYCNDDSQDNTDIQSFSTKIKNNITRQESFLYEDRGKTFRIALYLLAKSVDDYYLAGPNLNQNNFGIGMKRFLELNQITVKEILFEPTLRIAVNAYNTNIEEKLPASLPAKSTALVPVSSKVNEKIKDVISYIEAQKYGQTLLYCSSPANAIKYSTKLSNSFDNGYVYESYPDDFKQFIIHIQKEYDINHSVNEWSLIKILKNGYGMHHGQLPKYIQREILEQFNKGVFKILFCTSTIVEGVNTDAKNMIIMNKSKGNKSLSAFDIKNIKGRAGRYHHCFVGRVYYMNSDIQNLENSDDLILDFATYSDTAIGPIDLDNAEIADLTEFNATRKTERNKITSEYLLPDRIFIKNRTISKDNQEKLLKKLMEKETYAIFYPLISHAVEVESFLRYAWTKKVLQVFFEAGLIEEHTFKKYTAVSYNYYTSGFKGILDYELKTSKSIDKAYTNSFKCIRSILEHQIPKMLSLFESIIVFVAQEKGYNPIDFSLSRVCRYYETGVKSTFGEALAEYGFPTDAIRRIEEKQPKLYYLELQEAKQYCREHYSSIKLQLDEYENVLFNKALNTI